MDLLRGVALLLRVASIRGAAFAALLLFGLPGYLLRLCCSAAGGPCAVPAAIPPGAALPPVLLLLFWVSAGAACRLSEFLPAAGRRATV